MQKTFFVTGISTEIGKTIAAAIIAEALEADFWKPIQSGHLHHTDSDRIRAYVSNNQTVIHPEAFKLTKSISPFAAAKIDDVKIRVKDFKLPKTKNNLIIEGTGGLLVPLNKKECVIDLIQAFAIPVILVSMNYTGSVNHTLLSIEALKSRKIPIAGIIFNGKPTPKSEEMILRMTEVPLLGNIPRLHDITKVTIKKEAEKLARNIQLRNKAKGKGKKLLSLFSF
ncbi:MAG: dethiobiotin synthase [Saprospiraceae bacterium]